MKVTLDSGSGFCFGVVNAVTRAEKELSGGSPLYCLGSIVHNRPEVERLEKLGLIIIDHNHFASLKNERVLIRAHGEPPETYRIALENNLQLIDATCPVVLALQQDVGEAFRELAGTDGQVVIFGRKEHAEVAGLCGQTDDSAIIVREEADLEKVEPGVPVHLFAQTTGEPEAFSRIADALKRRSAEVTVTDSICRQVSGRKQRLMEFAGLHEVIIMVSGKESSNGKVLFEAVRSVNPRSYLVSSPHECEPGWFVGTATAGICGATSTPVWLMKEVAAHIESMTS